MKNTKKKQNNKKKTVKRRDRNYKKGGATTTSTYTESPLTTIKSPQVLEEVAQEKTDLETRSLEELAKLKEERAIANQEIIEDASTVAKGVVANTLETAGDLIGIDIDNPEAVNKKLEDIKETFTDPKNLETLTETVAAAAEKGAVVLEAASPVIDPLVEKTLDIGSEAAIKVGDTTSIVFWNFIKDIPGFGLAYSLIQNASKLGEAGSAVVNATAELTTDTADSAVVFKKNLEELQNEAADIENRTADTVNNFNKPIVIPKVVDDPFTPPAVRPSLAMSAGGGKQITKKKNFKKKNTKRVRFAF